MQLENCRAQLGREDWVPQFSFRAIGGQRLQSVSLVCHHHCLLSRIRTGRTISNSLAGAHRA